MYGGGREKKGAAHETKKTKRETKRSKQAAAAAEAEADDGAAPSGNKRDKWLKKDSEDEHGSRRSAAWQPPQGEVDGSLGEQVFMRWDEVLGYADTYAPAPPYCTYGPRVPASCVLHVPEAQGSLPWAPLLYVRRPRTSLGRAVRSAYRGTTGSTRPSLWRALVATRLTGTPTTGHP